MQNYQVSYIFPISHRFRVPFHEHLREKLLSHGIEYCYLYSENDNSTKGDTKVIPWATVVPIKRITIGRKQLVFQHAFGAARESDLVILQQENALLGNYLIIILRWLMGKKSAFFGHGKNFQSTKPGGFAERWKRFWLTKVDWWFAYTEGSARIVEGAGFPRERITVFNNSIDTGAIRREVESISREEVDALRRELRIGSENVGIYIGGMYKEKRLGFLIEAAILIRKKIPDFEMLMVGAGVDAPIAEKAATEHNFVHYLGPKFGREKTMLAIMSKVFLMPGLVGLAVLDSFAYGLPMITTNVPYHSPEIDYLEDGINGIITPDPDNADQYARAVAGLLRNKESWQALHASALRASQDYSIESMAERFVEGVLKALEE